MMKLSRGLNKLNYLFIMHDEHNVFAGNNRHLPYIKIY